MNALSKKYFDGYHYLQKIINMPIVLPEISHTKTIKLLADHFLEITGKQEPNDYERSVFGCFVCPLSLREVNIITTKFDLLYLSSTLDSDFGKI